MTGEDLCGMIMHMDKSGDLNIVRLTDPSHGQVTLTDHSITLAALEVSGYI